MFGLSERYPDRETLDLDLTVHQARTFGLSERPFDLRRPRVSPCVGLCARGAVVPALCARYYRTSVGLNLGRPRVS